MRESPKALERGHVVRRSPFPFIRYVCSTSLTYLAVASGRLASGENWSVMSFVRRTFACGWARKTGLESSLNGINADYGQN